MEFSHFYTPMAEWSKALFYVPLAAMIVIGMWKHLVRKHPDWDRWIHAAVLIHFLVGAVYSGLRMLSTDPATDMMVRRFFAAEAWFCFACAAFYFLGMRFLARRKSWTQRPENQR
jgi:predicted membrane channel-forming protein YqfA (hemolysin III family)